MTYQEFITANNIRLTVKRTDSNPVMPDFRGDHYRVTLHHSKRQMSLVFSKGYGHNSTPPSAAEVLCCLASDAIIVDNCRDFEDFCSELGYDNDSRRAEKTYKAAMRQTEKLKQFLGEDLLQTLIYETQEV